MRSLLLALLIVAWLVLLEARGAPEEEIWAWADWAVGDDETTAERG